MQSKDDDVGVFGAYGSLKGFRMPRQVPTPSNRRGGGWLDKAFEEENQDDDDIIASFVREPSGVETQQPAPPEPAPVATVTDSLGRAANGGARGRVGAARGGGRAAPDLLLSDFDGSHGSFSRPTSASRPASAAGRPATGAAGDAGRAARARDRTLAAQRALERGEVTAQCRADADEALRLVESGRHAVPHRVAGAAYAVAGCLQLRLGKQARRRWLEGEGGGGAWSER
jgi:hypothetical protein